MYTLDEAHRAEANKAQLKYNHNQNILPQLHTIIFSIT